MQITHVEVVPLQLDLRRQYKNGFFGSINYTLSDTKTDSQGTAQNRFEALLDNNRPELSTSRAVFHVTHVINANVIYELPFGEGRKWLSNSRFLDAVFGGWQVGSIFAWQSGSPITFFSGRATFNRAARSDCAAANGGPTACNTAFSTMSAAPSPAIASIAPGPPSIRRPVSRDAASAISASPSASRVTPKRRAASVRAVTLECAVSATISMRSGNREATSSA